MDDDDATVAARARLLPLLEEADVAVGNFRVIGLDGSLEEKRVGPLEYRELLRSGAQNWGLWATAIRRETWARHGLHSEAWPAAEDLELWLRWLREGVRFRHLDAFVHLYMLRPGSVVFQYQTMPLAEEIRTAFRTGRGVPRLGLEAAALPTLRREVSEDGVIYEPWQRPWELEQLLLRYQALAPRRVLEIGTARGGSLRSWLEHAPYGATVVSVDLPWNGEEHGAHFRRWVPEGVSFHFLSGDSHDPAVREQVRALLGEVDFLFLDGDHSYEGVRRDWEKYGALVRPGGLVALHDIAPAPPGSPIEVRRLWEEIARGPHRIEELVEDPEQEGDGIGIVYVK